MRTLVLACLLLVAAASSRAAVITVDAGGGGDHMTVADGIAAASPGDTVQIETGIYSEYGLVLKPNMALRSVTGDPASVTIDGGNYDEILRCENAGDVRIEGLRILHGRSEHGAMYADSTSLTLTGCVFESNASYLPTGGGAFRFENSTAVVTDCLLKANYGGGAGFTNCPDVSITATTFFKNTGGGIRCDNAIVELTDSVLDDNCCASNVTLVNGSDATLTGCVVYKGATAEGGGISADASSFSLTGCSVVRNIGSEGVGLFLKNGSTGEVENTIIAFSVDGNAVTVDGTSTINLTCTDIYGNEGGDWTGSVAGQAGISGNLSSNPLFCSTETSLLELAAASPCLPAGNSCGVIIGARGMGCAGADVPEAKTLDATWSTIKSLYR